MTEVGVSLVLEFLCLSSSDFREGDVVFLEIAMAIYGTILLATLPHKCPVATLPLKSYITIVHRAAGTVITTVSSHPPYEFFVLSYAFKKQYQLNRKLNSISIVTYKNNN